MRVSRGYRGFQALARGAEGYMELQQVKDG